MKLNAFYASSIGTREKNQDNVLFPGRPIRVFKKAECSGRKKYELKGKDGVAFAVSDGMGGASCGEIAALNVIKGLAKSVSAGIHTHRAQTINDRVLRLRSRYGECGATLVCVEFRTDGRSIIAYIESVGDSPCFLIRDEKVRKITRDDTLYQDLLESGELPEDEYELAAARSGLMQYFGKPDVETQKYKIFCEPGDVLVLCSDGVPLEDGDESAFFLRDDQPARKLVCESVSENKYATDGASDNTTAIVIQVEG